MQVTTIKLQKKTKNELDEFKEGNESYDVTINRLIDFAKHKSIKLELIEAYKNMGKKDLEILSEWETTSAELNDE